MRVIGWLYDTDSSKRMALVEFSQPELMDFLRQYGSPQEDTERQEWVDLFLSEVDDLELPRSVRNSITRSVLNQDHLYIRNGSRLSFDEWCQLVISSPKQNLIGIRNLGKKGREILLNALHQYSTGASE